MWCKYRIIMKAAFHYIVRVKYIRTIKDNETEFPEYEKKFEDDSPILAREKAFDWYQTWIDNLLLYKGKQYTNDRNARVELSSFYEPETRAKIRIGEQEVDFSESFGLGIGVFMVIDQPQPSIWEDADESIKEDLKSKKKYYDTEFFIHGIGNIGTYITNDAHMFALWKELEYYQYYDYETKNYETYILYCCEEMWADKSNREFEPAPSKFLETPFDWEGYDQPYWWGDPVDENEDEEEKVKEEEEEVKKIEEEEKEEEENVKIEQSLSAYEKLIASGESHTVEFKPALLYNFKSGNAGIGVKGYIAKAICAFLNSNGGVLFIGVSDDGKILGLDDDFKLSGSKSPRDFFLLEFDNMLRHFFGFSVKSNVEGEFHELGEKVIFVVTVHPIRNRAIFLNGQFEKEFYVRGAASSNQLADVNEIVNYCIERWIENNQKTTSDPIF